MGQTVSSRERPLVDGDADEDTGRIREVRSMTLGDLSQDNARGGTPEDPGILKRNFPYLRWASVQGCCIILELLVFVFACVAVTPRGWVTPHPLANWKLGSSDRTMEQCAYSLRGSYLIELRRTIVPIFLHMNIPHILFNVYFQFSEGTRTEVEFGSAKFLALFLLSGMAGNLLSDAFGVNGVGASTSCYGLIGVQIGRLFIVEWPHIQDAGMKTRLHEHWMRVGGMLVLWEVLNWQTIDHFGHGGGLLAGICLGCVLDKGQSVRFSPLTDSQMYATSANGGGGLIGPTPRQRGYATSVLTILMLGSAAMIWYGGRGTDLELICPMLWRRYFKETS
ncbi:unnamed protein product [Amoebophrya sp. A25]|nr:unnamed protein product [Amoebophrya sp. A25]|eukprot:GSA25T00018673001.1